MRPCRYLPLFSYFSFSVECDSTGNLMAMAILTCRILLLNCFSLAQNFHKIRKSSHRVVTLRAAVGVLRSTIGQFYPQRSTTQISIVKIYIRDVYMIISTSPLQVMARCKSRFRQAPFNLFCFVTMSLGS